jgi:hypothetical protein
VLISKQTSAPRAFQELYTKIKPLIEQPFFCAEVRCESQARFSCPGRGGLWYDPLMNYTPPKPVPESIAASLARSEAQIAAGQTVPLEPVLDRLRSSIARMQADDKLKTPTPEA